MKKIQFLVLLIIGTCVSASAFAGKYPFQVKTTGSGSQAIVFIPGFACSGDVWNKTVSEFAPNHTCYILTMAGFAGSPAEDSVSFALWEKGIANYIRENKIVKPVIVGHSMGGGLAMALAADYPELICSAVVVDALPCLGAMVNPNYKAEPNKDCTPMLKQLTSLSDSAFRAMQEKGLAQMMADTSKIAQAVDWSVASDRKTFAKMYCDFMNTDLRERIATVRCPVLVLLESYFSNFKPGIEKQYSKMKTADLEYAQKGLHFVMYDDTDWYLRQLHQFIKS